MKNLFVPYEMALLAKEKRFNEPCIGSYYRNIEGTLLNDIDLKNGKTVWITQNSEEEHTDVCAAPLYQQLVDWFRDGHNLHIVVNLGKPHGHGIMYFSNIVKFGKHHKSKFKSSFYDTHIGALNSSLTEAFKLINP